jgi:uncharacterized protein (TIGR00255 family)
MTVRMPRGWLHLEDPLKKQIQQRVKRGRVDVFVTIDREPSASVRVDIDWTLADGYIEAVKQLSEKYQLQGLPSTEELLRFPGLVHMKEPDLDPAEQEQAFMSCAEEALGHLMAMRQAEGEHLSNDLHQRLHTIDRMHQEITMIYPQVVQHYRTKLAARIKEMIEDPSGFDDQRFAMEVALMAERTNIDEELTRLHSHLDQFKVALDSEEPIGRKLDFLIQEMNREVNTMGSKSNDQQLVQYVVELKSELEKIREQVQNIE